MSIGNHLDRPEQVLLTPSGWIEDASRGHLPDGERRQIPQRARVPFRALALRCANHLAQMEREFDGLDNFERASRTAAHGGSFGSNDRHAVRI
jgi:hypothetical protein